MPDPRSLLSCATEQLRQPAPAVRGSGGSNLGLVLTDKGRDMEAEECFRRALVIDQAMPSAFHLLVAVVCLNLASRAESRDDLPGAFALPTRTHTRRGNWGGIIPGASSRDGRHWCRHELGRPSLTAP
jgi:hypothetical protein